MTYSKKMLEAMALTIQAYEQSILDLETGQATAPNVNRRWDNYGASSACRLCKAAWTSNPRSWDGIDCSKCILNLPDTGEQGVGCTTSSDAAPEMDSSYKSLRDLMFWKDFRPGPLEQCLRDRLEQLFLRCEENGYVFEEVE